MDKLQSPPVPARDAAEDARLAKLSATLKGLRDEAIKGRLDSGVEAIWTEDREYYDGIDDSNRAEKQIKPTTSDGRVTRERKAKKTTRSNIFLNITRHYVSAAAAYVSDKLFRSDVSNFGMRPTPKPDLIQQMDDHGPALDPAGNQLQMPVMDEQGQPQMQPHTVNGQPMMDQATGQPIMLPETQPAKKSDVAKAIMDQAKKAADKAKNQVDDWLNECGINGHSRQVVDDAAMIGTGVLKGPFPEMTKKSAVLEGPNGIQLIIKDELAPRSRRISAWNLYPDPSCGTDIHRGKFIFEDDEINSRLLGELKADPNYIASAIDRVLEEGPKHAVTGTSKRNRNYQKGSNELFQIWYYHGYLSVEDLEACGYEFESADQEEEGVGLIGAGMSDDEGSETVTDNETAEGEQDGECCATDGNPARQEHYPCIVVMVNDTVIKATVSPFDSGRFPYNVMRWGYRDDHWAGVGVARMMRTSQDGVNAGVRMLHDNAGVSGAPILVIDRSMIIPADGVWGVGPHKIFYTADDYDGTRNIREAITWILTPSMQGEMMNIIQFWMAMAEKETGLPMLMQGQSGQTEHTLGEAQLLNNNGSSLLRRVTNIYDDDVTKPHIGGYYEWILLHGDDDSMKGDFTIDALGSSVLIERDQHSQLLMQMLGLSTNPAYGADPEAVYREFLLSQRFDAEKLMLTDEKKAELAKRQPPEDPRVTAAKIAWQGRMELEKLDDKDHADHAAAQAHMEMNRQAFEAQQAEMDRALQQYLKNVDAHLESARISGDQAMNGDNLKVALARESMKLRTQVDLAMKSARAAQVATPAFEPPGRAQPGKAFIQ